MKKFFLIFILLFTLSCQDTNSNSLDALNFGQEETTTGDATTSEGRYQNALNVLNTRCVNCHTGYHASWASDFTTEQQWIDGNSNGSDLVTPGNTDSSSIVSRLQTWGSVNPTMPQGEAALTQEEFNYLDEWIRNL